MNHERVLRAMVVVVAVYLVLLALWLGYFAPHSPPGTLPYQVLIMVGLFGVLTGVGLLITEIPSRADRRLQRCGLEGWARIEHIEPLTPTDHGTELAELALELTVPGEASYHGSIVYDLYPADRDRLEVGNTVEILVDPADRDHILLL